MGQPLTDQELTRIDAYWRAANYLSVGQIYLLDNPLLREPLRIEYVKQAFRDRLIEHRRRIVESGEGPPEIRDWRWGTARGPVPAIRAGPCREAAAQPAGVPSEWLTSASTAGNPGRSTGRLHHLGLDLDLDGERERRS